MNAPLSGPIAKVARTGVDKIKGVSPLYLECEILLVSGHILGHETFHLENLEGKEGVSEPFEFTLTLHGDTTPYRDTLTFSRLIGRPVNVGIGIPNASYANGRNVHIRTGRHGVKLPMAIFNGIVAGFSMQEPGIYQLTMRPALWRMTLTNHYRMFAQMSVRQVLDNLCQEHRLQANFDGIKGNDNLANCRVQDWLQAGESDYEFMRRLMGKAHIFFYFVHQYGQHTLTFANRASYPGVFSDNTPLRYTWTNEENLGLHQLDVISQYSFQQNLGSSGVHGVFVTEEQAANVENRIASYATFRASSPSDTGELPFNQYRIYQYGGSNNEVRHYTQASNDALQTGFIQLSGASFCPLLRVGHQFRMSAMGLPVQPELEKSPFVVTGVSHKASLDGEYTNQFQATDARGLITPLSVADTQQGALLAKVVAHRPLNSPGSWPYYTPDNFDMQKEEMQDSQGVSKQLQAKGVYVRFSTDDDDAELIWVKITPSMQHVPEVGTMVLVSRANDESELPEIQSIHADGSMTVTPNDWTAHSQVGNAFSTSYGDSKSIRFGTRWSGADTAVAVNIVETAYDRKVFRDASYSRGGSYSYSCSESMATGMLGESWSYGCSYSNAWAQTNKSFSATGRSYHESVTGDYATTQQSTESSEPGALAAVQASKSLVIGDTWSKSTSNGNTIGLTTYNGNVTNTTTHNGNVVGTTTHNGDVTSTTAHNGKVTSTTTHSDIVTSTTTHEGKVTSTTTHNADVDSTTHYNKNVVNTTSHTGTVNSTTTHDGAVTSNTTHDGTVNSTTTHNAKVSSTTTHNASIDSDTTVTGVSSTTNTVSRSEVFNYTGASSTVNISGATSTVNITGLSSTIDVLGAGVSLTVKAAVASVEISGPVINIPIIIMVM